MAKDLFSIQAADYSKWRPTYPSELIQYIISFVQHRNTAWDCATGNGQAALLLAEHMKQVFATDLSAEQLKHAKKHPKIIYSETAAEQTSFADNSFDLVTVAQSYHWLNHQAFCAEANRVCKSGGLVAIWGYNLCEVEDPVVTAAIKNFYKNTTGAYWDAERRYVDEEYQTVYFNFEEIPVTEKFAIRTSWSIHELAGYLNSWSSVQKYINANGTNPVFSFIAQLSAHWPEYRLLNFEFPIFLRLGKVD